MNLQKIEELIGKYEKGETSAEEEKLLKDFFLTGEVPEHLKKYQDIFLFYSISANEQLPSDDFDEKVLFLINAKKDAPLSIVFRRKLYAVSAIAASIIILIGLYFMSGYDHSSPSETFDDPKLAYLETKKILHLVSSRFNEGFSELKNIEHFNTGLNEFNRFESFQTGLNSLEKVSIFDKSKEMITLKNK